jgi:anti-anti-sigma regulatory factor
MQYAESRGIEFRLRNIGKLVKRILEITKLDSVFKLATEKEVGKAPLARPPIVVQMAGR